MIIPPPPGSLREGLPEMFTLQRLRLPPSLHKCLATTNLIENHKAVSASELARSLAGEKLGW
jgi:hypothetical protein